MINVGFTDIDNAKMIGRLLPFWARGRRISLLLQAILNPIVADHRSFQAWALERYAECHVTAQPPSLQWYLAYKLSSHFRHPDASFRISQDGMEYLYSARQGLWDNDELWDNGALWGKGDETMLVDTRQVEDAEHIRLYAPEIVETVNYDRSDYERDIRSILSKYLTTFGTVEIVISDY